MTDLEIKKPRFWTKVIAGLAGALMASGQIPEVLLPLFSEGVYQALGGVVAAIMAGWIGKDKVQEKKRSKTKRDLMGLLVLLVLLAGCAGVNPQLYTPPAVCLSDSGEYVQDSLILEHMPNPRASAAIFKLINYELMKRTDIYSPDDFIQFAEYVKELTSAGKTYFDIYQLVSYHVEYVNDLGGEVLILSDYFGNWAQAEIPVSDCDAALIARHMDEQIQMAKMVK